MVTFEQLTVIAILGAAGCLTRFLLSQFIQQTFGQAFPFDILFINIIGCFFIGFIAIFLLNKLEASSIWRIGAMVGFLGGLTTFSSFTLDTVNFLIKGHYFKAILYILTSVIFCLLATVMGMCLGQKL